MTQPINMIFRWLQTHSRIDVWLFANTKTKIQGVLSGFDEYMNLVLTHAQEIHEERTEELGTILLKGDNISLMRAAAPPAAPAS
ncbi:putative Small nuclear ribonucleoprotein E [Paratrimastix pyriformis]|uniref:Small nuclear ribonucleoprotein E n=1 Tax=Paratrimastix pyriformis TaxID=342808 RepID=A0ABQ8US44_9EUKA|nr:putative Small nuclear ribonucleoprotein E [Paratrimastix pyriformis]